MDVHIERSYRMPLLMQVKLFAPREDVVLNKDENVFIAILKGKWALVQRLMEPEPGCVGPCSTGDREASHWTPLSQVSR